MDPPSREIRGPLSRDPGSADPQRARVGGAPGQPGYTAAVERESLRMTLDELELDRPHLAGWSGGGRAALEFAMEYPERIRTLTLIEPAAFWILEQRGDRDPVIDELNAFLHPLFGRQITEDDLATFLEYAGFVSSRNDAPAHPDWERWLPHRMARSWQGEELDHPSRTTDDFARVSPPTLLVKGTVTAAWQKEVVDVLGEELPNAIVLELKGDHACHIQSMDAFMEGFERQLTLG